MARGFTLFEVVIVVLIMGSLLSWGVPQLDSLIQRLKIQHLANELYGLMMQARSEATLRNQRLWIHIYLTGSDPNSGAKTELWRLELSDTATKNSGKPLSVLLGSSYGQIELTTQFSSQQISFDPTYGRPSSGNIQFYPQNHPDQGLKIIAHYQSGRIRVCNGDSNSVRYGFQPC